MTVTWNTIQSKSFYCRFIFTYGLLVITKLIEAIKSLKKCHKVIHAADSQPCSDSLQVSDAL